MKFRSNFIDLLNQFSDFPDDILTSLSNTSGRFDSGLARWRTWESENSSFGKTFRYTAFYPKLLPLYFCSDHAVHWESKVWPNEINSPLNLYLSWNKKKCTNFNKLNQFNGKKALHVPHPWILYRKSRFGKAPNFENRSGTLVFWPHSNDITTPSFEKQDEYILELKALPIEFHPIRLCLSFHDIKKGVHLALRKYGLPIVTAGTTNSTQFVDRFYSLIYQYKYVSSSYIGSHTFYSLEAGIPFFLLGAEPIYHSKGSESLADGKTSPENYGDSEDLNRLEELKYLLKSPLREVSLEQKKIVAEYLGLNSTISRLSIAYEIWKSIFNPNYEKK